VIFVSFYISIKLQLYIGAYKIRNIYILHLYSYISQMTLVYIYIYKAILISAIFVYFYICFWITTIYY